MSGLADVLREGVRRNPAGIALREPGGWEASYAELDALVERIGGALAGRGVGAGDRVAVWLEKSIGAVAAMQAVLRRGAAYVPIDPSGPVVRAEKILAACQPAVCVCSDRLASGLGGDAPPQLVLGERGEPAEARLRPAPSAGAPDPCLDEQAYILNTSGSTGEPKGVRISHRNALAFVEWAHAELAPSAEDCFANHAPLHFDLSVLDLYVAFRAGATVVLIPDGISFAPARLVDLIRDEGVTIWYSVPTVLSLMIEQGELLAVSDPPRAILFAGEPFAIKHLRRLREAFKGTRLLNLYGPTETNVCSFEEVFDVPPERTAPAPIGRACCGDRIWAEGPDGEEVEVGDEGELVVEGPTVMLGYWDAPPQTGPYRTGDRVRRIDVDRYEYVGRGDSMVKVRGNRVELGEVEAAVGSHPIVDEAAVIAAGSGAEARLVAFVVSGDDTPPTLLEMKRYCAERLPRYMVVHKLCHLDSLPRTANGKVDRRALAIAATGEAGQ